MGTFDFLNGGEPYTPEQVNLDPQTNQLIDQSGRDSLKSSSDLARDAMQGTGDTNFLSGAKGSGNVAMSGALTNKYGKLAGDQMQALGAQQGFQAEQTRAQRLQQSAIMANARQQVANQNYARQIQAYNNQQAARAQVLSSLMGLAGTAAGAYFGGPGGAVAGGAAGNKLGGGSGMLGADTQFKTDP